MPARFTFHRGSLALDLAGTVGHRASEREERLPDRTALAVWLREAGLLPAGTPVGDEHVAAARELREAIARAAGALADDALPPAADLETINAAAQWSRDAAPRLDPADLTLRWTGGDPARAALGRVAADALDLIARRRERLVRCRLPACGALLLSNSRGAPRRWCSMQRCGNVAKVAAHRARRRAGA